MRVYFMVSHWVILIQSLVGIVNGLHITRRKETKPLLLSMEKKKDPMIMFQKYFLALIAARLFMLQNEKLKVGENQVVLPFYMKMFQLDNQLVILLNISFSAMINIVKD